MASARDFGERRASARPGGTRARIQAAAIDLFLAGGVEKTSLRELADQLGITKAALYYHFPSKEALVRSLVEPLIEDVETFLAEVEAEGSMSSREFLGSYFDLFSRHRKLLLILLQDLSAFANLGLVERLLDWRSRVQYQLVGPDFSTADQVRVVVALGGLQDAAALLPEGIPEDEAREVSVDAALAALGTKDSAEIEEPEEQAGA